MADTDDVSEPLVIPRFRFDDKGDKKKLDDFKASVGEVAKSVTGLFEKVSSGAKKAGDGLVTLTGKFGKLNEAVKGQGAGSKREKVFDLAASGVDQIASGAKKAGEALTTTVEKYDALYFTARRTGASAANLKAIEYAAGDVGLASGDATDAVESLSSALRKSPENEGLLKKVGIQTRDANGTLRDSVDLLAELARRMNTLPASQANKLGEAFELDDKTMAGLRDGDFAKSFAHYQGLMQKTGVNQAVGDAHQAATALREVGAAYDDLVLQTQGALLHSAGPALQKMQQWVGEHRDVIQARGAEVAGVVGKVTDVAGAGLLAAADQIASLDKATNGWSTRLAALTGGFVALGGPKLISGIRQLAQALGSVGGATEAAEAGVAKTGLLQRLGSVAGRMWTGAGEMLGRAKPLVRGAFERAKPLVRGAVERAKPLARGAMEGAGTFLRGAVERAGPLIRGAMGEIAGLASRAWPVLSAPLVGLELMLFSGGLNKGESEFLRKVEAMRQAGWNGAGRGLAHSTFAQLISRGEGGYDSVNRGQAHGYASGTENLENMTVAEVMAAQRGGRFNAAGRYQMIGDTLSGAVKALGLSGKEKFDRRMQDRIFEDYLVKTKRRGIMDFVTGKGGQVRDAVYATAKEWASVAVPEGMRTESGRISDGRMTYYDRQGRNRASITEAQMTQAIENTRAMYQSPGFAGAAGPGGMPGARPMEIRQDVTIHVNGVQDAAATGREVARHQARAANDLARQVGGVLQ